MLQAPFAHCKSFCYENQHCAVILENNRRNYSRRQSLIHVIIVIRIYAKREVSTKSLLLLTDRLVNHSSVFKDRRGRSKDWCSFKVFFEIFIFQILKIIIKYWIPDSSASLKSLFVQFFITIITVSISRNSLYQGAFLMSLSTCGESLKIAGLSYKNST